MKCYRTTNSNTDNNNNNNNDNNTPVGQKVLDFRICGTVVTIANKLSAIELTDVLRHYVLSVNIKWLNFMKNENKHYIGER